MKRYRLIGGALAGLLASAIAAGAQQTGSGNAPDAGALNQGRSAGEMQRVNPPTTSNEPSDLSGGPQGANPATTVQPVPQAASPPGTPGREVPRSDSAR